MDAISDDGNHALTLIAFIGSVFSPYYAWANRKGPADPENFCAMNMVLYEKRGGVWAMTERGAKKLERGADRLRIGPSSLHWDGQRLAARIDEIATPLPRRLRGNIELVTEALQTKVFALDEAGRHRWRPIAPVARIAVNFDHPKLSWQGQAYFDCNDGDAPLAADFSTWHWSRMNVPDGVVVLYDVARRRAGDLNLALKIGPDGVAHNMAPPPVCDLPGTLWRVKRQTRADAGFTPVVVKTLEDAPFYARSRIVTRIDGAVGEAMHESLSLDRFAAPWVRALLPFRMPRF